MFPQHPGIARALADHQLLVVVGPLVREAAGLLGLRELAEAGLAQLDVDATIREAIRSKLAAGRLAAAFEAIKDRLGPGFAGVYEPLLAGPKVTPPASLRALVTLAGHLRLVLTTNLDNLVENTLSGPWVPLDEVTADLAARTHTVVKLLGTAHRVSSWRFTADGLHNATYRLPYLQKELSALLRSRQLLLLGYRGDDELLDELVRLREHAPDDRNAPQWVALVPPGASDVDRARYGKRGLHVVEVEGGDAIAYDEAVAVYLRQLARTVPAVGPEEAVLEPQIAGNPYPGLMPFDEAQAGQFFGRADACAALLGKLGTSGGVHVRWLAVTGASGVGKSSLLAAGVVPALRTSAPPVRDAPTRWVVAQMRPGREVLRNLAAAVREALARDLGVRVAPELLSRDTLAAQDRALADFLAARLNGCGLLLVLDQFEEAFTIGLAEDRPYLDALLVRSLQDVEVPFYLVTAMRSDCVGELGRHFPRLAELQNIGTLSARHDLQPLRAHELREAIERPAELAGRVYEPGLVERILHDVGALHEPNTADDIDGGRTPDAALPLVAHVLHALHAHVAGRMLSLRAYEDLGGVAESLTRDADGLLAALAVEFTTAQVRGVLVELVELHPQSRDSRRVLPWSTAVAAACDGDDPGARTRAEALLRRLSGGASGRPSDRPAVRLVATHGEGEQVVVDLVHDALLREWATLRGWLQEDREVGLLRQELARAAEGWVSRGRPDDELWRGSRLAHASETLQTQRLLPDVHAFLAASTVRIEAKAAARDAEQAEKLRIAQRNNWRLLGLGGVLLVVAIVALFQYRRADGAAVLAGQRLSAANTIVTAILSEVLPALDQVSGAAATQKQVHELLVDLQTTLLSDAVDDRATLRNRMVQHQRRGILGLTHDDLTIARQEHTAALRLAKQLAKDPTHADAQRDLSHQLGWLGDLEQTAGNLTAARTYFVRALVIDETMVQQDPDNVALRRDLAVSLDRVGDVEQTMGRLTAARVHFNRALFLRETMVEQNSDDAALLRDLAASLDRVGDAEQTAGNLTAARVHSVRARSLREAMVQQDPGNAALRRDFAISLDRLGAVEQTAGNRTAARALFDQALSLREMMVQQDPDNAALRRDLSVSLDRLGDVEQAADNLKAARDLFDRARSIDAALVQQDPNNAVLRRDLSVSLNKLGAVEKAAGNLTAARALFEGALAIDEAMVQQDRANATFRRDLAASLDRLGEVEQTEGHLMAARARFTSAFSHRETMAEQDPGNAILRHDLTASFDRLGGVEQSAGNLTAARGHFEHALAIYETMVQQDPGNAALRRDQAAALDRLGDAEQAEDLPAARDHFDHALSIRETMAQQDPDNVTLQHDLAASLDRLGDMELGADNLPAARALFDRALALREPMVQQDPDNATLRRDLAASFHRLGDLERAAGHLVAAHAHFVRALSIREPMAQQSPHNTALRRDLAVSLGRLGDVEQTANNRTAARALLERALSLLETLVQQDPGNAELRFDLVSSHMSLAHLATTGSDLTALRKHVTAADSILDDMEAQDQLKGFKDREVARVLVEENLAKLPK